MVTIEDLPSEPVILRKDDHGPEKVQRRKFTIDLNNPEPEKKPEVKSKLQKRLEDELDDQEAAKGYPRMTKAALKKICKEHKLYSTPYLNDQLYLHFKGWWRIENLDEYTGLRCLWLESNGLRKIENLENQTNMRCLYMQQNLVQKIENLENCQMLAIINLESNQLKKIENLSCLPKLETLHLGKNHLSTFEALEHLTQLSSVTVLELHENRIDDPRVLEIFSAMPNLRVLNLMKNPVCGKIRNYRKTLTVQCKELTYLDDRPVFPRDRACAEAWAKGGVEAEREERQKWQNKERRKIDESLNYLRRLQERAQKKREKALEKQNETLEKEQNGQENEEHELGKPLNQLLPAQALEDDDLPDLEKVEIDPEAKSQSEKSAIPEGNNLLQQDPKNDYMVNLEASIRSQSAPPKGFRNIEIELDSDTEDEEIDLTSNSCATFKIDDLPDLEKSEKSDAWSKSEEIEEASSSFLEANQNTSVLNVIPEKKNSVAEMLFTKVDRDESESTLTSADQSNTAISKPLIQELDSDDEV